MQEYYIRDLGIKVKGVGVLRVYFVRLPFFIRNLLMKVWK